MNCLRGWQCQGFSGTPTSNVPRKVLKPSVSHCFTYFSSFLSSIFCFVCVSSSFFCTGPVSLYLGRKKEVWGIGERWRAVIIMKLKTARIP